MTATSGAERLLDELLARRPVELVPFVAPGAVATGAEMAAVGIGLHRKPATWDRAGDVERFGAVWETTARDWLPCSVVGIGVVVEPGGPPVYVLDTTLRLVEVGDELTVRFEHPVRAAPAVVE